MKSKYKLTSQINTLIKEGRYFEAMNIISENDKAGVCRDLLSEAGATYRYMLAYFERSTPGVADTSRAAVVSKTGEMLRCAADRLEASTLCVAEPGEYFSAMRIRKVCETPTVSAAIRNVDMALAKEELALLGQNYNVETRRTLEDAADRLFVNVQTAVHLSKNEQTELRAFLFGETTPVTFPVQCLAIGALLMGSLMYYDRRKLELLTEAVLSHPDLRVRARAIVAMLIVITKHSSRIDCDPEIIARLEVLGDNEETLRQVREFVLLMLRTLDTDRVNKQVNEEIFPELMRLKPDIEKSMRRMGKKLERAEIEENPDWEDILGKSGITDKLKELSDMQMDGADIFMSAFSQMKRFPFFRRLSNWLLPYDKDHSEVHKYTEGLPDSMLTLLGEGNYFCSSDKYSMALAMAMMPKEHFNLMSGQLNEQLAHIKEEMGATLKGNETDMASEMALYLKDLYRYFKLKNDDTADPFIGIFELKDVPPFAALRTDRNLLRNMAEFYFRYGYWQQAESLFGKVLSLGESAEEDLLQKQGYCLQLMGRDKEALRLYMQAELLNSDSDWLLKRIATLLRDMQRYGEAAEYVRRALARKPENLQLELLLGNVLMLDNHPQEALKSFYKIKYLRPDKTSISRHIAWCEFLMGNYAESIKTYESLSDIKAADMLNCGHASLASGDMAGAKARYRSCIAMSEGNVAEFRRLYAEDRDYLLEAGVNELDISLMEELATASDKDLAV